jgi:uncharacterized membrane protein
LKRIVDLVWEGFTLKHIFEREIFIPYLLFLSLLTLFEVYLIIFLFSSFRLLASIGYKPTLYFYGIGIFLITIFVYTVIVLIETVKGIKGRKDWPI